jgi:hypothetical protein
MLIAAGLIGMGAAAALSMISAIFRDPRQNRSEHIAHITSGHTVHGAAESQRHGEHGRPISTASAISVPRTFRRSRRCKTDSSRQAGPRGDGQWIPVLGRILNQFGGSTGNGTTSITIQAMDGTDVARVLNRNAAF